jgi:hypothetical protein
MKRFALGVAVAASAAFLSGPVMAGNTDDGTKLTGKHFNLNIIGVNKGKKATMTNSNRHTIFMPLRSGKTDGIPDARIWLNPGEDFHVCDGNGFDPAHDCDGYQIDGKDGAVFELPCNLNLTQPPQDIVDRNGEVQTITDIIACNQVVIDGQIVDLDPKLFPEASYTVWVRALGAPNGSAEIETCATVQGELVCSMENTILTRTRGKSSFTNVTDELTSLVVVYCFQEGDDGICEDARVTRIALFAGDTEDWFWGYTNDGLRLAQVRFYPEPLANVVD